MFKKVKEVMLTLLATIAFALPLAAPRIVAAQASSACSGSIQSGLECGTCLNTQNPDGPGCPSGESASDSVNNILKTVINILSLIVGVISVIFVIIGGFKFITSSGDAANVSSAQKTIIYALVGLVVVALAQVIVRFVLDKATTT